MPESKEPIARAFGSPEEMAANAEQAYQFNRSKENKEELAKGFDIHDLKSVMEFEIGYTPIGNSVIIKEIQENILHNGLFLLDSSETNKKYVVIVPGLLVTTLNKGDIVSLQSTYGESGIRVVDRRFKGIKFGQVDYNNIAGVYKPFSEMLNRIKKYNQDYYREKQEL